MPKLKLFLLGPPRLEKNGRLLAIDTRKAVAMLAYLTLTNDITSRDTLAAFLWPEFDDSRAKAALRRTLSALKAAVGDAPLYITRDVLGVEQEQLWCDALAFQTAVATVTDHQHPANALCTDCLSQLETAVALHHAEFLAGFSLRDSLPFDEWQRQQAEILQRQLDSALEQLVASYSASGNYEAALAHARRWLQLDPLREEAHRQLMQLYAWSGQRSAALLQYRDCVRVLEEELGVAPLAETAAIYHAIQEDRLEPPKLPPAITPSAPPALSASPTANPIPLIGRAQELATLQNIYGQISTNGRLLAITGEAGIGKTRLAEAFLAQLPPTAVCRARCYAGETHLAYDPFVQAMRDALHGPTAQSRLQAVAPAWLAEAARLLPELHSWFPDLPTPPALDWPGAPGRFFAGLGQTLDALLSGPTTGVLWLDDVQWIDSASLDLLAFLGRRWQGRPFLLLLCWREGESTADERLNQLLAETRKQGTGLQLALRRLDKDEVSELVQAAKLPLAADLATRLYRETEGLPFLITAYLHSQLEPEATSEWTLPHTARDLFQSRLNHTSETGQQLLQAAAVIGRAFEFELLLATSGRSEEETMLGLEALLVQRLLAEQAAEAVYDFDHHKLRELIYEEMTLVRRRLLHRRVAQALANRPEPLAAQIAKHYQLAGQDGPAAVYYKQAGDHARALFAHQEALAHYQAALALGHEEGWLLHEACGDVQLRLGRYHGALTSYEQAAASAPATAVARLEHKIGQLYYRQGEWKLAEHYFERAAQLLPANEQARLLIDWSTTAYRAGEVERAATLAAQAQSHAADPAEQAQVANTLGILARHNGDMTSAKNYFVGGLELAAAHGLLGTQISLLNNLALLESALDNGERAHELLRVALTHCLTYGDQHWEAALRNNLADVLHQLGREEEAMVQLKQAVVIYASIGRESGGWQPEIWKLMEW